MNKVLKFIGYSIVTILVVLSLLIIVIGEKDIPREQLKTKYAQSPSKFWACAAVEEKITIAAIQFLNIDMPLLILL